MDNHKNFSYSTVATAPSPATSGTSLVVAAGQGALFPTVPFNAVIWPTGSNPLSTNAEIVRVTNISTDTFTITRAQESSSARTVIVGDQIAAAITKKTFTDIETLISILTATGGIIATDVITAPTGTTAIAPLNFPNGALKTTPARGDFEFDGNNLFFNPETTAGHGSVPVEQRFRLTADGSNVTTGDVFPSGNMTLVANAEYEIDVDLYFIKNTAGTISWQFLNSAAPTLMNIFYRFSPAAGISVNSATYLDSAAYGIVTATANLSATSSLTDAARHYAGFRVYLINGSGTSLKFRINTQSAGTITPAKGSRYVCRRVPAANVGTLV